MAFKRWKLCETDKVAAKNIAYDCEISGFQALLLQTRGLSGSGDVMEFLYPERLDFNPFSLKDMDKAVECISRALDLNKKITIYGDYDADGVTATAILLSYLQTRTENVDFYIPERNREGYGLNDDSVNQLYKNGTQLIITVDNGISAFAQVELANSLGMEVVVTDHHMPSENLPAAVAVVDAHRTDCKSTYKNFAGVGVALMLICALEGEDSLDFILDTYAAIACIGTVADIVPLTGINRVIVKNGLESMRMGEHIGINAIAGAAGIDISAVSSLDVAFKIAPRINALGRLGSSSSSVELLLSDDTERAAALAGNMNNENEHRRQIGAEVYAAVEQQVELHPEYIYDRVIVIDGSDWHGGVLGIVASKIVEKYGKPCIIITTDGEISKGSGRSISGFSLYNALEACSDVLLGFGGHELAAGLTLESINITVFRKRINDYARDNFKVMPAPEIELVCKLNPAAVNIELCEQIDILEPFGSCNTVPVFALCNMKIAEITASSSGKHLKLTLLKNGCYLYAMLFFKEPGDFCFKPGDILDIAVTLEKNEFKGRKNVTVKIIDYRPSGINQDEIVNGNALFERFKCGETLSDDERLLLKPEREQLAAVYRTVRMLGGWRGELYGFYSKISEHNIGFAKMLVCLLALGEKELIKFDLKSGFAVISLCKVNGKVDITDCEVLKKLRG